MLTYKFTNNEVKHNYFVRNKHNVSSFKTDSERVNIIIFIIILIMFK